MMSVMVVDTSGEMLVSVMQGSVCLPARDGDDARMRIRMRQIASVLS